MTLEIYTINAEPLLDNAVINPRYPNNGNRLTFEHCRELIFPAGNEYRRFEIVNMHDYFRNVDRMSFYDPYFHAGLMKDTRHHAYNFDNDHNGRFLIRYNQAADSDTEADYLFVHFTLSLERLTGGRLYVSGDGGNLMSGHEMTYDEREKTYQATLLLKQGAYDYHYLGPRR